MRKTTAWFWALLVITVLWVDPTLREFIGIRRPKSPP